MSSTACLPSPNSISVLSATNSGFGIPAKPGLSERLTTMTVPDSSTSRIGMPAIGEPASSRAEGFTTSLAPITIVTSVWANVGLTRSISSRCS